MAPTLGLAQHRGVESGAPPVPQAALHTAPPDIAWRSLVGAPAALLGSSIAALVLLSAAQALAQGRTAAPPTHATPASQPPSALTEQTRTSAPTAAPASSAAATGWRGAAAAQASDHRPHAKRRPVRGR